MTVSSPSIATPSFSLRVWAPDEFSRAPDQQTLRQFFESSLLPGLLEAGAKAGTIEAYYWALRHWEGQTADPPLAAIDADPHMVQSFLLRFQPPQFSIATAHKLWRQLKVIFRRATQESDSNPDGMSIIQRVPRVKLKRQPRRANRFVSHDELDALYDACEVATFTRTEHPAPLMWRCQLVCFKNLGPRTWDFFCSSPDRPGANCWRWEWINWRARTIRFRPDKTGDELRLPMHDVVMSHLQQVYSSRNVVFPATKNKHYVYGQWARIKRAAGFAVDGPESLRFQHLRATCQTEWDMLSMGLGDFFLGHAPSGVGATWYRTMEPVAMKLYKDLPQPKSFLRAS